MDSRVERLTESLNMNSGASAEALTDFLQKTGRRLPEGYLDFMRVSNGAEGFIGDGGYLMLWPIQDLVECNRGYNVREYAPDLLVFGSDGGGEAYAFDTRQKGMPIVSVPFVGMSQDDARPCGSEFVEFLQHLSELGTIGGAATD